MNGAALALGVAGVLAVVGQIPSGSANADPPLGPRVSLGGRFAYRAKADYTGFVVKLYDGNVKVGATLAHWAFGTLAQKDACAADFAALGVAKATPILQVYQTHIESTHRGRGLGIALYEALMAEAFDQKGPFVFVPSLCSGNAGHTSAEARRVYVSLAKRYPSAGWVIRVDARPVAHVRGQAAPPPKAAPPIDVEAFGRALRRATQKNEAFKILDADPDLQSSDWGVGGCAVLALAVAEILGPIASLHGIVAKGRGGQIEHVVVAVGDRFLDGDGASTREVLLRRFGRDHRLSGLKLVPVGNMTSLDMGFDDRLGDIRFPPAVVDALVAFLRPQLPSSP